MNPSTPKQLVEPLRQLVESREALHERDLFYGEASVWLPYALDRKYPSAHKELKWQFLFASAKFSRDPKTRKRHRHHLHSDTFPVHLRRAVQQAKLNKHVTSHTFRHSFATHLMQDGIGSENPKLPQGKPAGFRAPPLGSDYGDFYSVILKLG